MVKSHSCRHNLKLWEGELLDARWHFTFKTGTTLKWDRFLFFPVTFKGLLSCLQWTYESFPAFSILAPEGCIVHWESSDLYQCTKNPLPCWSYQLSFSKRPEETRGDQGRRSQSVSGGSSACKAATLVMLKTRLLFNIAHKIAWAPLCSQLVFVRPHMNVSKDFGRANKNVQYNGWNPVLTSSASISWFFWIPP